MKRVQEMRSALERIPGALIDDPGEEWHTKGDQSILWHPLESEANDRIGDEEPPLRSSDDLVPVVELAPEIDADVSAPLLGDRDASDIRARVSALGVDALAWYVPFHQNRHQWGCYLSDVGIRALADALLPLHIPPTRRVQLAVLALLRHEVTHFAVEYMASQWELSVGAACYWLAKKNLRNLELGYIEADEKLANAYMLRGFRFPNNLTRCPGAMDLLRQFTTTMPRGYSEGYQFTDRGPFHNLMSDVAHKYVSSFAAPTYRPDPRGLDLLSHFPDKTLFDTRYVPVFFVKDSNLEVISSLVLRFVTSVKRIEESNSFKKKLARMSEADQRAWERTKRKLSDSALLGGVDFKPWPSPSGNEYSVRVSIHVRAHLRFERNAWSALQIGQHTEMGHD